MNNRSPFSSILDDYIKGCKSVIILYFYKYGAHYVSIEWDSTASEFVVYNCYGNRNVAYKYKSIQNDGFGKWGAIGWICYGVV